MEGLTDDSPALRRWGQSEEAFVNLVLVEHLAAFQVYCDARCVETSRRGARIHRGGVLDYRRVRKELDLWMREDGSRDSRFTTMLDLYRLPPDFPGYAEARRCPNPRDRVLVIQAAFHEDFGDPRFIPYIQLHGFEALILADPAALIAEFMEHQRAIDNLVAIAAGFESPELINDGENTAPSKRIDAEIRGYAARKVSAGPRIAARIGLPTLRSRCPHFDYWIGMLESLSDPRP